MDTALAKSYEYCRALARQSGSNFYYPFLLLPREKRDALCVTYAFMRQCDDLSDDANSLAKARDQLLVFRKTLDLWITSAPQPRNPNPRTFSSAHALWPAFADVVQRYKIPARHLHEVIDGAEMDLTVTRYQTFEDLYRYCYCVASAVGLVCLRIFGFKDDAALLAAEQMGIAFQLTNILRDVKEDAARGRIYLPLEDLREFGVTAEEVLRGEWSEPMAQLIYFQAERAESYYSRATALFPLVERDSRATVKAMANIYRALLKQIKHPNFNVFERGARVSTLRKMGILIASQFSAGGI